MFVDTHTDESAVGWNLQGIRASEVYRRHRERAFVHSGMDHPIPLIPGFYPSIEGRWSSDARARSACYLAPANPEIRLLDPPDRPMFLASFVGSCSPDKPVRAKLIAQSADDMPVRDTHAPFIDAIRRGDRAAEHDLKKLFVELAAQSSFMLCPAGVGASSFRIFEAMEMGRAPVVIADAWTPVTGPDWNKFSVRIRETDIPRVRAILKELEPRAATMAVQARLAWETHFAPSRIFDHLVDQCVAMLARRLVPESVASRLALLHFLRPKFLRKRVREIRRKRRQFL